MHTTARLCRLVALLSWFLADGYFPQADASKVMRLAVLHDLGEAYVGDLTPHDGVPKEVKHARERQAVEQMLLKLPRGKQYLALWEEYERGESLEAPALRELLAQAERLRPAPLPEHED